MNQLTFFAIVIFVIAPIVIFLVGFLYIAFKALTETILDDIKSDF